MVVALSFAAVLGNVVFEAGQQAHFQERIKTLEEQENKMLAELNHLKSETAEALEQLARIGPPDENLRQQAAEIHRLRGEVTQLRSQSAPAPPEGTEARLKTLVARADALKNLPRRFPQYAIPELQFLTDDDWMEFAKSDAVETLDDEIVARNVFNEIRRHAKFAFASRLHSALTRYLKSESGLFPKNVLELKPYLDVPIDDSVFLRYEMLHFGSAQTLPNPDTIVLAEKAPVDPLYDTRLLISTNDIRVESIH
jgi:hypothetical protein